MAFPLRYLAYAGGLFALWSMTARKGKERASDEERRAGTAGLRRLLAPARELEGALRDLLLGTHDGAEAADGPAPAPAAALAEFLEVAEDVGGAPHSRDPRAVLHYVAKVRAGLEGVDLERAVAPGPSSTTIDEDVLERLLAAHAAVLDLVAFLQVELDLPRAARLDEVAATIERRDVGSGASPSSS